ncbi:MAG TPA: tRNA lysidine(34) synthetase TilS, partial [Paludibacter sp.]|nr:tRNA lysidine(34) synthetase TilS [Paludibacter sp.]
MQQKVQKYIEKHSLLTPSAKIIVGVSGGTDSVVLLHLLQKLGYDCIVAHCNFHLRMDESDRDEAFVRSLANSMKLPCYIIDFNTVEYSGKHKLSIEMAARELRYNWFSELLKNQGAEAIAVAHHADDSIETMLMNLVRGTGIRGLSGIPVKNGCVVRPLLCCSRNEIENYLIENGLDHIEDSTNATSDYTRNKFRNEILPLLEEINPSVRQTFYQTIDRFEGIQAIYQQSLEKINSELVHNTINGVEINIEKLKSQAHVATILYEILFPYGFHPAVIEQIEGHLDSEPGKLFYSESHRLLKDRKCLIINANTQSNNNIYTISQKNSEIFEPIHLKISRFDRHPDFAISKENN